MPVPLKLGLFSLALVAAFVLAYFAGSLFIPSDFVDSWMHTSHN